MCGLIYSKKVQRVIKLWDIERECVQALLIKLSNVVKFSERIHETTNSKSVQFRLNSSIELILKWISLDGIKRLNYVLVNKRCLFFIELFSGWITIKYSAFRFSWSFCFSRGRWALSKTTKITHLIALTTIKCSVFVEISCRFHSRFSVHCQQLNTYWIFDRLGSREHYV